MKTVKVIYGGLGALAAIATIIGTLVVLRISADDIGKAAEDAGEAFIPIGLIVVLALAAVALSIALVLVSRRQSRSFSPADQDLLDRMLGLLSRPVIRGWQSHDFSHSWPRDQILPVEEFRHEFGDVEHRFENRKLEAARERLGCAADEFAEVMGQNAFPAREERLNLGWPEAEIEGDPRREQLFLGRQRELLKARREFTDAHDEFLRTAKKQGFDIGAVAAVSRRRWDEPERSNL